MTNLITNTMVHVVLWTNWGGHGGSMESGGGPRLTLSDYTRRALVTNSSGNLEVVMGHRYMTNIADIERLVFVTWVMDGTNECDLIRGNIIGSVTNVTKL
jgi:hypothetical protein